MPESCGLPPSAVVTPFVQLFLGPASAAVQQGVSHDLARLVERMLEFAIPNVQKQDVTIEADYNERIYNLQSFLSLHNTERLVTLWH